MTNNALLVFGLVLSVSCYSGSMIEHTKNVSVRDLDSSLPNETLEKWVNSNFDIIDSVVWNTSDCGEAQGNPEVDLERDFSICGEVSFTTTSCESVNIQILIGKKSSGIFGKPKIWQLFFDNGTGWRGYTSLMKLKNMQGQGRC